MLRHLLYGFPYLLYLAEAQFGLVEQDEMLVEVAIAIQYVAFSIEIRVTTSASCLLNIVFQRVRNVIMHHKSHVILIHSHTESRSGNDDFYPVIHESLLIANFLLRLHLSIVRQCLEAVAR